MMNNIFNIEKLIIIFLCIIGCTFGIFTAFPGHTNFDEFNSLNEILIQNLSNIQPPLHSILWLHTIKIGEFLNLNLSIQTGLLLLVQSILFWYTFYIFTNLIQSRILKLVLIMSILISPISLLYLNHIGKDSQLAIFFFVSTILIFSGIKKNNIYLLILSLFFIFYASFVRSNGLSAGVVILFYWAYGISKILDLNFKKLISLFTAIFILFLFINSLINTNFIKNKCCAAIQLTMVPVQGLMAMSYYNNVNLIPKRFYRKLDYSLIDIKKNFKTEYPYWDGLRNDLHFDDFTYAAKAWWEAFREYPESYIKYKVEFLNALFAFKGPAFLSIYKGFYISKERITSPKLLHILNEAESLPKGFKEFKKEIGKYFLKNQNSIIFRPWLYILIGIISLIILKKIKVNINVKDRQDIVLINIIMLSSFLYILPYIIVGQSVSIRYFLWPALGITLSFFKYLDIYIKSK